MTEKAKKILGRFQRQCARREYCVSDIRSKLSKEPDLDPGEASEILESLLSDKFVDDLRYASAFAREKSSLTGWGPIKIRFALSAKGITGAVADEALREIDSAKASSKLDRILETKAKSLEGDPEARLKLLKFALSRGYDYESVREKVNNLF